MKNILKVAIGICLTGIAIFVVISCTDSKGNTPPIPKASEPIPVTITSLERSAGTSKITASGQLTTDDETILGFKTPGVVESIFVREGEPVKKGQLLAKLHLTEIDALVAQAKHGLEKTERDFQRARHLYEDSVATLEQLQNAETAFAVSREQYQAAIFNRSYAEIHAPANGFVLKKFVNPGQVVGIGDPIIQTNGASEGKWILKISVSDKQWSSIRIHDKANVSIDAIPGKSFKAVVLRKSETADPQTGVFTVDLGVANERLRLANGMFGSAEFLIADVQASWNVPYEAVLDATDDEGFVFVTADLKTAIKQPVTIESFNGQTIRISKGLETAKALIVSGSAYLSDKSPITVIK
jgi:RND family efflux transporter MFP subunit